MKGWLIWLLLSFPALAQDQLKWAQEYQYWRGVRGHYYGATWNPDVDRWGGQKHILMLRLEKFLAGATEQQIVQLMGTPDEVASPGSEVYAQVSCEGGDHVLVYEWRARHDFLYFVCVRGVLVKTAWWNAGDRIPD